MIPASSTDSPRSSLGSNDPKLALDQAMNEGGGASSRPEKSEDYRINIPVFEGPFDLLLHLIRKEQINIYDIPIAQICKTYLEHLELLKTPDVDLAGEFMVMAATLIQLKSLVLLPKEEGALEDDPRMPLVQQLLEYQRFQKAADKIDAVPWLNRDIYSRSPIAIQDSMPVESLLSAPLEAIDSYQLLLCLKIAVNRTTRPPLNISTDPTSIKEKVISLAEFLEKETVVEMRRLLPACPLPRDIIVSFLAILELARLKFIEILQHETFGPIQVRATRPLRELNAGLLDQY